MVDKRDTPPRSGGGKSLKRLARIWRGVSSLRHWAGWGGTRYGFYIPYKWAHTVDPVDQDSVYPWLKHAWDEDRSAFEETLSLIRPHLDRLKDFARANPDDRDRPRFDQSWFPGLDGAAAYALVRELEPSTVVEIGSGHSTRFLARGIRDHGLDTQLVSVDPQPRRSIDHLCDETVRATLDEAPPSLFADLRENDILFFDGSHIAMPGTDVDTLINRIMPDLAPGVWVHIHDVFLPHGYPEEWEWRGYNEQNVVAALLAGGDRFEVRFASAYVRRHMGERIEKWPVPLPEQAFESSLWLSVC